MLIKTATILPLQTSLRGCKTALLPLMKSTQIPVRYFAYDFDNEEVELIEVDKQTFDSLEGKVTTERHTMFTNGCNQVCHTKENY